MEAQRIVEDLVRIKSYKFAKRYLGPDDIAQEIRIKCWKALPTFDKEKGQSLKTYLNVVTENHLRNLMRDKFATFNPPCKKKCDHYDAKGAPTEDAASCPIFVKYLKAYKRKCSVRMPSSVDSVFESTAEGMGVVSTVFAQIDLDLSIRQALIRTSPGLVPFYIDLTMGKKIPYKIRNQIQVIVKEIL
jgi:hypothetical protein